MYTHIYTHTGEEVRWWDKWMDMIGFPHMLVIHIYTNKCINGFIYIYTPTCIHVYIYIYEYTYRRGSQLEEHMDRYVWCPSSDVHMLVIYIYTYILEFIFLHI